MASNGDSGGGSNGTISRNFPTREYDSLKLQIEKTNNELNTSRRRCDHALSDLDYYREQHRAVMNQLEVSSQDSASLRTRYAELLGEHKQLQAEHRRLGQQQQQQAAARGDGDALLASHAHALAQLEAARSDSARLAEQCEALGLERGQAQRDVAGLKQQLVKLFKDNAKFREAHQKLQQQYEEAVNCTIKANKEIKRLTDERNATTAEYTLIMSERDTVHKEMEKLSDDLAQSMKKMKLLNAGNQELQEEKRNFTYQLESLRREITSALHERDKALRECAELREKFGELGGSPHGGRPALGDAQARKSRGGRHADGASGGEGGEGGEGGSERSRDDARGAGGQRRRPDTLDQANQELEALRKSLDKANAELAAASQEAEVSKRRRDWAFGERDKIVQERESIRTLCDNMRKERDRAVSELAESLRESDAVKRQRNELLKEAKTLREALDAQCDDDGGDAMPAGCDRQPPHEFAARAARTEVVELELTASDEAGLEFGGGRDFSGNGYVFVSAVAPGSTAEGKLHPNDYILRVNDVDCSQGSLRMVTEAIRSSMPLARVLVRRHGGGAKPPRAGAGGEAKAADHVTKWIHTARLAPGGHGLALKMGVYVHRIGEGGTAARDKTLTVGDRVLRINDKSMDDIETSHDAMQVLNDESADVINITTLKMSYPECPNVFTPVRRHKKENRSSQTDDWLAGHQQQEFKYGQEKNNGGAWLKEKLDMMRGPWRHSKEDKKKYRNSSPNPIDFGHEQAIAELDLVLESYHHGTVKRQGGAAKRHFSQTKDEKNNGGTWPKARAAPLLTSSGGTVATRARERPPLSLLAPPPDGGYSHHRNSTPAPLAAALAAATPMAVGCARHAACKSADATRGFGAPPGDSLERLGAGVHSDHSLDFPVHRFVDKEVIAYYKKNSRSGATRYGSDSERDSLAGVAHLDAAGGGAQPHSRGHSQPFVAAPRAHHPFHALALAAPPPAIDRSRDSFSFEPIHHAHSPSADVATAATRRQPEPPEAGGTFPRKNQRFRVPSNPSVTSKLSTGSIERGGSERGSPMPIFHVEVLSSPGDHSGGGVGGGAAGASKDHCPWGHKPVPGELRRVHIDKSNEPLGIQINCPDAGGIFVSTVNENSLASRVGLQIGDQLLEVCGINMRNATYNLAANVLRQCGNSITMLVQYSPDKYHELQGGVGSCSGSTSESEEEDEEEADGEATPCNSPKEVRKSSSSQMKPSQLMVMQRQAHNVSVSGSSRSTSEEPRYLCIETLKTSNLGISLVGGNAAGVFIHSVQPDSLAYHAGLRTGDQILEYNGTDLRAATAEEAAYELAKPADKVAVLAHYRIDKYNEIKDKPGDSLYVRCGFDRGGNDMTEPPQLSFAKDEVVYVDNTMFNGVPGQWRAWKLDGEGHRQQCGVIPSKYKVEEELLLRRGGAGDPEGRSTATARRSFFRRKKHQRGSSGSSGLGTSRDSKELASFCNLSPGWYSDSGSLHEDLSQSSYQRVERLQHPEFRPVIVLGPLAECVADKLVQDFPDKFNRASTESRRCSQAQLDRELAEGLILEYRRRGSCYECITVAAVRAVAQTRLHCMLDGSVTMAERLRRHHVHPVVLLVKFKSTKQIREVKDARYSIDKVSGKAAKEMFEHGRKLEAEYRHLVTAVVAAGANVAHICAQVKAAVDAEHGKSQWVPTATLH